MSIGIVGLGYVGLPLAVAFAEAGHDVVGLDVDARKVEAIGRGDSYVEDIPSERLQAVAGRITATTRPAGLAEPEAILICVPTPLTANREPDLGPLLDTGRALAPVIREGQLIVLESTTYPGTTEELVGGRLEQATGLRAGPDFHLGYSPERIDPGNLTWTLETTPKVVSGIDAASLERVDGFYSRLVETTVPV